MKRKKDKCITEFIDLGPLYKWVIVWKDSRQLAATHVVLKDWNWNMPEDVAMYHEGAAWPGKQ